MLDIVATPVFTTIVIVSGAATQASVYRELVRIKEGGGATIADVFA